MKDNDEIRKAFSDEDLPKSPALYSIEERIKETLAKGGIDYRLSPVNITGEDIHNWFTYHPPTPDQVKDYQVLRDAAREFAGTVFRLTPAGEEQRAAILKVREAVMMANAAIACQPQNK